MRPSTPHYTSPADLRERMTRLEEPTRPYRIQTGIAEDDGFFRGGAIRGLMFAILLEGAVVAIWFAIRFLLRSI